MAAPILLMLPRLCVVGRFFIFERTTARSLRRRRSLSRRERISGRAGADAKKERRLGVGCEGAFRCLPRCGVVADTVRTTPDVQRAFQCKNKRGDARVEHLPSSHTGRRPRWHRRQVIYKTCTACAQFNFDFASAHQSIAGRRRWGSAGRHEHGGSFCRSLVRYLEAPRGGRCDPALSPPHRAAHFGARTPGSRHVAHAPPGGVDRVAE